MCVCVCRYTSACSTAFVPPPTCEAGVDALGCELSTGVHTAHVAQLVDRPHRRVSARSLAVTASSQPAMCHGNSVTVEAAVLPVLLVHVGDLVTVKK